MHVLLKIKIIILIYVTKTYYGFTQVSTKCLYAQALHETGDFKSVVFRENKNLFGMREPKVRKTRAIGSNKSHAVFKNHCESIIDYFLRQKYFNIPNSTDSLYMLNTVKSNYAEDKKYLQKWNFLTTNTKFPKVLYAILYGGLFFLLTISVIIFKNSKK
jgi:hypothetical protein